MKEKVLVLFFLLVVGGYNYLIDYPLRVPAFVLVVVDAISLVYLISDMVVLKFLLVVGGYTCPVVDLKLDLEVGVCLVRLVLEMLAVLVPLSVWMAMVAGRACRPTQLQGGGGRRPGRPNPARRWSRCTSRTSRPGTPRRRPLCTTRVPSTMCLGLLSIIFGGLVSLLPAVCLDVVVSPRRRCPPGMGLVGARWLVWPWRCRRICGLVFHLVPGWRLQWVRGHRWRFARRGWR